MTTLTAGQPPISLPCSLVGAATDIVAVGTSGRTAIRVGVTGIGSAVLRVEFGFVDGIGSVGVAQWIDAGTGLDLDASTPTVLVPLTGVAAVRLAVRTADDVTASVWIGEPT
jgi:hypothetical protein